MTEPSNERTQLIAEYRKKNADHVEVNDRYVILS
jgi:hypothetical protein